MTGKLRNDVRLAVQAYIKPFVKRQKNIRAHAEAIVEASPNLKVVRTKHKANKSTRTLPDPRCSCEVPTHQRSPTDLSEHGIVASQGDLAFALKPRSNSQ